MAVLEEHKRWCENLVNTLKDGGVWGIPRSGLIFRVDKGGKQLLLVAGDPTSTDFPATVENFGAIGWKVVNAIDDEKYRQMLDR